MAKIIFKFDIHKLCEENFCRATIFLIIYVKNEHLKVSSRYHGSIIIYSCTTIKLRLYDYRVCSCTTKEVIAVQLKRLLLYD